MQLQENQTGIPDTITWSTACLFLPATSGFFYDADQSQTQSYDALSWKGECCHCKKKGRKAFAKQGCWDEKKG